MIHSRDDTSNFITQGIAKAPGKDGTSRPIKLAAKTLRQKIDPVTPTTDFPGR